MDNNNLKSWKRGDPIEYIRKDIPEFEVAEYKGEHYEAMVPDTLDLQERAALAVNGLTGPTDPEADHEIYWIASFKHNPPRMQHDGNDHVQVKFMEALPLMRLITGSDLNKHVDRRWMEVLLHMQGPDGSFYYPVKGRPWWRLGVPDGGELKADHYTRPFADGVLLGAMAISYLLTGNRVWLETGEQVVQGLIGRAIDRGDYAYFSAYGYDLGASIDQSAPVHGGEVAGYPAWALQGLVQFFRVTGYEPARELARKLACGVKDYSGLFAKDGMYMGFNHFHLHTKALLAIAEYASLVREAELFAFVQNGYDCGKTLGEPLVGYFPEWFNTPKHSTCEICEVADMIALGLKLTLAGVGDYWDDVDRWVRNQFIEGQLVQTDWIYHRLEGTPESAVVHPYQSVDKVPERNVGAFGGWLWANDWNLGTMHCCTGNATRALYYVWENILTYDAGKVRVNLLLNRASPWADVDSYIPYEGRVDVKVKQACELWIRISEWVKLEDVRCETNGRILSPNWDGRYLKVGSVKLGDVVTVSFPIEEHTETVWIQKHRYTLVLRGNDVVSIDPPGQYYPLYQRVHYRQNHTRWKKITRFVPDQQVNW